MKNVQISQRAASLLDASRAAAAVYVVLYHVAVERGWTVGPGVVFKFGQEAVMIFFLLSGFVIFANERHRSSDGVGYFMRRVRRIYPALLIAMLVSLIIALLDGTLLQTFHVRELIGTLLAFQDLGELKPGVIVDPFLGNAALWTLSYEILFYLLFPLVMASWRVQPRLTTHLVGAVSCLAYLGFAWAPNHWLLVISYFGVWWAGAMAADAYLDGKRNTLSLSTSLGWLLALSCAAAVVVTVDGYRGVGVFPFLQFRHFFVALVALVIGFGPVGAFLARLSLPVRKPAAAVASISYGLYVLHFPLLIQSNAAASTVGLLSMSVILIALSYWADRYLNDHLPRWKSRPARLKSMTTAT